MQHSGTIHFSVIGRWNIYVFFAILLLQNNLSFHSQIFHKHFHVCSRQSQHVSGLYEQFLFWKVHMAFPACHAKCIHQPTSDTKLRISPYACFSCNFICDFKSYTGDIFSQFVWIVLHDRINFIAILLVDPNGHSVGYTILLQKTHSISGIPLFKQLYSDLPGHALTNSLDFCQSFRLPLDDLIGLLSKSLYDSGCQGSAHTLDGS